MEWNISDKALRKLKSMLWGLESLRIFRDKLKKALAELDDTRKKMILKADEVMSIVISKFLVEMTKPNIC